MSAMPADLRDLFQAFVATSKAEADAIKIETGVLKDDEPNDSQRTGRPKGSKNVKPALTQAQHDAKRARSIEAKQRRANIMIMDFETDPFDNVRRTLVKPFLSHSGELPVYFIYAGLEKAI